MNIKTTVLLISMPCSNFPINICSQSSTNLFAEGNTYHISDTYSTVWQTLISANFYPLCQYIKQRGKK